MKRTLHQQIVNPKRILYIENGFGYGGAIICLRHLVRNLDRSRYLPMIVTGRTGPEYQGIADECLWQHIADRHIDVVELRKKLESSKIGRKPWLKTLFMQIIARIDDLCNFTPFFLRMLLLYRSFKPDIVHLNNEPLCNRAALLAARLLRIPIISHVRGPLTGSRSMYWLFTLPDHFIPVSHWVSADIGKLGIAPEKRTVVYDGLELEKLDLNADGQAFRSRFNMTQNNFAVGLVGLIIPWKGQRMFLEAARQLKGQIPGLKMLIVGGTPEDCRDFEHELKHIVKEQDLEDTVIFTGHVSDMPVVYNGLDVAVSASITPEPLGTMVIETMTMARPLIAPAHGGGAEMNTNGETALLFEPGNVDSLTRAILELYHDPELGKRLGAKARTRALSTFAVTTHVENVQKVYAELLDERL